MGGKGKGSKGAVKGGEGLTNGSGIRGKGSTTIIS